MWIFRTDAGEVPSGLGWLCRRGALLRRWESALLEKIQLFERRRSEFWIFFSGFSRIPAALEALDLRSLTRPARPSRPSVRDIPYLHNFTICLLYTSDAADD